MKSIAGLADIAHLFGKGTTFVVHSGCAAPPTLSEQLAELARCEAAWHVFALVVIGDPPYVPAVRKGDIDLAVFVPGRAVRHGLADGTVRIIRRPLSHGPASIRNGTVKADVLLLQLSPADENGNMSLGISCDAMPAALERAGVVVAEINQRMPRTFGATTVRPEQVDFFLQSDRALVAVDLAPGDETDSAIADNIAGLINDDDVLQTGIGSISDLTVQRLRHRSRMRIHTGIITEALQPLIENGNVIVSSGGRAEPIVATMAAGSQNFYRFLHENRAIMFEPCDRTHDKARLAAIRNLCAINGALEIDLHGRVNAEQMGGRVLSAPGGQPDFTAGAVLADGGKSIIALRAASRDGGESRIVANLAEGTITTEPACVTHVVTEHGVAHIAGLRGNALKFALAEIAAPQFRAQLRKA